MDFFLSLEEVTFGVGAFIILRHIGVTLILTLEQVLLDGPSDENPFPTRISGETRKCKQTINVEKEDAIFFF